MRQEENPIRVRIKRGALVKKLLNPFFPGKPFGLPECVGPHRIKIKDKADRPESLSIEGSPFRPVALSS